MTKVQGHWFDQDETQAVCAALTDAGYQALFVGGCVRNALLGEEVGDIDIATDALPDQVTQAAKKAGLKPVPTGIDHGTITVVSGGIPHEVTTFRHDVETDGRRAVVAYTDKVDEDARRRDFTMNALYARPDGTLVDPLGGLPDLRARRVLFIEDARDRIKEDYLRILRFFRFFAWYGDPQPGIDPEGLSACAELSDGLDTLSKERIGGEICKLLSAPDPAPAVAAMSHAGCLSRVLPGAIPKSLPVLVDFEASLGVLPDAMRRLAVLGGEDPQQNLRLSRARSRRLDVLRAQALDGTGSAELAYRHGSQIAHDVILVRSALTESALPAGLEAEISRGANAEFPITASDLRPGFEGAALGARLKELERRWIESGFAMTREALLA